MKKYIIKRLVNMVITFIVITEILILIFISMPGDWISAQGPNLKLEDKQRIRHELYLDRPKSQQFIYWTKKVFTNKLGYSPSFKCTVSMGLLLKYIGKRTYILYGISLLLSLIIGIPIGVLCAVKRGSTLDNIFTTISLIGICIPAFFWGSFFIYICFSYCNMTPEHVYMLSRPFTLIVVTLANIPVIVKYIRSSMIDVLNEDYINTARAKGLKEKIVCYKHAFKNANITFLNVTGTMVNTFVATGFFTECMLGFPGIGANTVWAVHSRDYTLMLAWNLILCFTVITVNFIIDMLCCIFDPRIRRSYIQ